MQESDEVRRGDTFAIDRRQEKDAVDKVAVVTTKGYLKVKGGEIAKSGGEELVEKKKKLL